MTFTFEKQIPAHASRQLPGLSTSNGWMFPNYGGYCLSNLPAAVCSWLGVPQLGSEGLSREYLTNFTGQYEKVVFFLIDGMGLRFLERCLGGGDLAERAPIWNRLAGNGDVYALTSTSPSTTSTALTSLWTGVTPAEHGVIGYEMWLKEFGVVVNMVTHAPSAFPADTAGLRRAGFRPETFLPVPTLGSHLALHGVSTRVFQHHTLTHSGLSTMLMDGVEIYPYLTLSDLWVSLTELLENWRQGPLYTYIYWSDFDLLQHRFSSTSRRTEYEFVQFSQQLADFIEGLSSRSRNKTLFVFAADHGQVPTPPSPDRELARHAEFNHCLAIQPTCENRLAFLYLHPGMETRIREYVKSTWEDDYFLISSQEAIRSGLFGSGKNHPSLPERVGDLVSIARNGAYWWWSNRENRQVSRHGGLSSEEMLVPLLLCTL